VDIGAISDRTVPGIFLRQAARLGDRVFLHHWTGERWEPMSWDRMRDLALRVATRLVDLGIQPHDRVLLMSPNRIEWSYTDLGIQCAGAVSVPVYASSTEETTQQIAANSEAVVAVAAGEEEAAKLRSAAGLRCVVTMDRDLAGWASGEFLDRHRPEVERRLAGVQPDDLATIIYTSGTTGEPKGVVLLHRNLIDMARSCLQAFTIGEQDVGLSFLPLAHVLERESSFVVGMMAGTSGYLARSIEGLVDDLRDVRPTIMVSVPRVYEKMFDRVNEQVAAAPALRRMLFNWAVATGRRRAEGRPAPGYALADRLVLSRLRTALTGGRLRFFVSGGAPLARDVEAFFWAIGVKILQGWGMTETTSGATSNTETEHRYGTVGRALPGVELRVAEDGEILVRGPGIMQGYFRNEQATAEVLDAEGWLRTGDVGELDDGGFLTLTDRKKDLIKTAGGKYVAPQPIEARLQEDPGVERALVIGDGRPYCVALMVPNWEHLRGALRLAGTAGRAELAEDPRVRDYLQARVEAVNAGLGSWESIKYFHVVPEDFSEAEGELTPTLKVKRRVVTERHAREIDELYRSRRTRHEASAGSGSH
jgi:long-chain acyl-CoA synthetase